MPAINLALVAPLVGGAKPIPAFRWIGVAWLRWIDHQAALFLRDKIHPGASSEIVRRLGTAVEHDDQRYRLAGMVAAGTKSL
jgi:hypothetical protein